MTTPTMAEQLVPDDVWAAVQPLLPPKPPHPKGGRPWIGDRAVLGGIIEMGLLRLIYRRDPLMQLILTFGLILVISTLVLLLWGPDNKSVSRPDALACQISCSREQRPNFTTHLRGRSRQSVCARDTAPAARWRASGP